MLSHSAAKPLHVGKRLGGVLPLYSATEYLLRKTSPTSIFRIGVIAGSSRSSSSARWKARQGRDSFAREAKVQGLMSRAAFKLLEIDSKYRLFKRGQTVVDLGYAPGSWSQVAVERTKPDGRIVGIDILPAQPPKGVSTIQGNFLSSQVQAEVMKFLLDPLRGRPRSHPEVPTTRESPSQDISTSGVDTEKSYIDLERHTTEDSDAADQLSQFVEKAGMDEDELQKRVVDVVLSDMMMNTTGITFKDHAGSMDLCHAALRFSFETLKTGGHFVCKFYQGREDKDLEARLKKLFMTVHRDKPESSRSESKEAYFVALRRKRHVAIEEVLSGN